MYRCASHYSPYLSRPHQLPLPENGSAHSGTPCSVSTGYPWRSLTASCGANLAAIPVQSVNPTETARLTLGYFRSIAAGVRSLLGRVNAQRVKLANR